MDVSKIITTAAKAVSENKAVSQNAKKVITQTSKEVCDIAPDLRKNLSENAKYYKYSSEVQDKILNLRNEIWKYSGQKNNPKIFQSNDAFITVLINHCDDEKMVDVIFKNMKNYNTYVNTMGKLNSYLQKTLCQTLYDKNKILVNLTLMRLFNKNSFKALSESYGFKEILAKRLNLSYLKDIKPSDNIDGSFFYKLFDNIEKTTNERLAASGIDADAANKFIKLEDAEICKNPKVLEDFITKLEKAKNPQLVNEVLKKFELNEENFIYTRDKFLNVIDRCEKSPEIVQKVLRIPNLMPYSIYADVNLLCREGNKISDEIFEYFVNLSKNHPRCCTPTTLTDINSFLSKKGTDEKLLKEIFEKSIKTGNPDAFSRISYFTNEKNLDFLKKCLENETLDAESLFKLKIIGINPSYETQLDKVCEEIFRPLLKIFEKKRTTAREADFIAGDIAQMKLVEPEIFKKIEDSGILDLVLQEKINPRILRGIDSGVEFTPEILSDVKKLLNGESPVKKFETTKDVLKNTNPGDVISVKGKMYINNNGKLERWNMTEEKFNGLFPLVDRFSTSQGRDDCYLISVLNSLYYNPKTRGNYYKMFEQKGNDIFVTIPAYENYGGAVKFTDGKIQQPFYSSDAAVNVQMIEQAYARTSFRDACHMKIPNSEDPLVSDNLDYLQRRLFGGNPQNTLIELLANLKSGGKCVIQSIDDKTKIKNFLDSFGQNPRYIINETYLTGRSSGHVVSIKDYDAKKQTVTIMDPCSAGKEEKIPLNDMLKDIYSMIVTRFI